MDLAILRQFFFWSMVINSLIYLATAVAIYVFKGLVQHIHAALFGLDEQTVNTSIYRYLASYKLLITFFNFTPWMVLLLLD